MSESVYAARRAALGISIVKLAGEAEVSYGAVKRLERGENVHRGTRRLIELALARLERKETKR